MKAVVFHGVGDIRIDEVPEPKIEQPSDAIVHLSASAICGTDLHMVRGSLPGMKPGTILGHEGVGVVTEVGRDVRNWKAGDRVVVPSTIACGYCSYCRAGYHSQCDNANPNGKLAGTSFYGGPEQTGPINGLQAEKARIPFAHTSLVALPEEVSDEQAILLSDIFPTAYFGAELAEIEPGNSVVIFGCGPVGQFCIASAKLLGAGRIFAVDTCADRLEMARDQDAEIIDFNAEDPVEAVRRLTGGVGADRAIDAVGVDANRPREGPAATKSTQMKSWFRQKVHDAAQKISPESENWRPGDAPEQAMLWAVEALAKAGTLSIIGVYPMSANSFPIGQAMNKNLTIKMGNCPHRKYLPMLVNLVRSGTVRPEKILTKIEPLTHVIEAYKAFDERQPGWMKVALEPALVA